MCVDWLCALRQEGGRSIPNIVLLLRQKPQFHCPPVPCPPSSGVLSVLAHFRKMAWGFYFTACREVQDQGTLRRRLGFYLKCSIPFFSLLGIKFSGYSFFYRTLINLRQVLYPSLYCERLKKVYRPLFFKYYEDILKELVSWRQWLLSLLIEYPMRNFSNKKQCVIFF